MKKYLIYILIIFLNVFVSLAQNEETTYQAEAFGSVSTGSHTPFWMTSQTWGMVPLDANNGYVRGEIAHQRKINAELSLKAGIELAASTKRAFNTVWIQQAYAELGWKKWNVRLGPKQAYKSFFNENLSSGDFMISNNARPIPEMNVSLEDFVLVPYTKGKFYLKGDFALGKMLDGDYIEAIAKPAGKNYTRDILTHHKSIFFRFGNYEKGNNNRFTFGMEHYAFWSGVSTINGVSQQQPNKFADLVRTFFAIEEGGSQNAGEYFYVSGSHWGAYTFKFDHRLKNQDEISINWQHFFDDGSGMGPQNIKDMLLSLEYKSKKKQFISGAVLEYLYTKNQSGSVHFNETVDDAHKNLQKKGNGMDDYYNNWQYSEGPSYYGRSFGTPLLLSPEYNTDGNVNFKSNRIVAYHGAIEGYFNDNFSYRLRATYGKTWGRYKVPFINTKDGVAASLDITYHPSKIDGLDFKFTTALNKGAFFDDNSFGTGISIIKRGIISKK